MLERVLKTISRYNMLAPGARVAVAVSGGADSVCLLYVLRELGISVAGVAHFNHKLRAEASEADERFVADLAGRLGLPFYRAEADLAAARGNLEQAGRRARRDFFHRLIAGCTADCVALGHTRDDQAETVLFRLLRGSGLAGLAGIHPVTAEGIVRPLLEVTRADVEQFLNSRGVPWREDATNRDPRFARNRIRHGLLPQLAREWNPCVAEAFARLADLAHEEEQWWGAEVDRLAADALVERSGGVELSVQAFAALPKAPARRLVRRAISLAKGDLRRIEHQHVEQVLGLQGSLQLPGLDVVRSFDWIRFAPRSPQPHVMAAVEIVVPGTYDSPDGSLRLSFEVAERKRDLPGCGTLKAELCWLSMPAPLVLRGWRPGDHYRPVGQSRDRRIKEMFQKARVPSWRRAKWPILTGGDQVVWAQGFGPAEAFAADPDAGPVLRVSESSGGDC